MLDAKEFEETINVQTRRMLKVKSFLLLHPALCPPEQQMTPYVCWRARLRRARAMHVHQGARCVYAVLLLGVLKQANQLRRYPLSRSQAHVCKPPRSLHQVLASLQFSRLQEWRGANDTRGSRLAAGTLCCVRRAHSMQHSANSLVCDLKFHRNYVWHSLSTKTASCRVAQSRLTQANGAHPTSLSGSQAAVGEVKTLHQQPR